VQGVGQKDGGSQDFKFRATPGIGFGKQASLRRFLDAFLGRKDSALEKSCDFLFQLWIPLGMGPEASHADP
jgi:hypothetical protein